MKYMGKCKIFGYKNNVTVLDNDNDIIEDGDYFLNNRLKYWLEDVNSSSLQENLSRYQIVTSNAVGEKVSEHPDRVYLRITPVGYIK